MGETKLSYDDFFNFSVEHFELDQINDSWVSLRGPVIQAKKEDDNFRMTWGQEVCYAVRFASLFIAVIVINTPESKQVKRTSSSVQCPHWTGWQYSHSWEPGDDKVLKDATFACRIHSAAKWHHWAAVGHWASLCVMCCRMVDSIPRWQLHISIQANTVRLSFDSTSYDSAFGISGN